MHTLPCGYTYIWSIHAALCEARAKQTDIITIIITVQLLLLTDMNSVLLEQASRQTEMNNYVGVHNIIIIMQFKCMLGSYLEEAVITDLQTLRKRTLSSSYSQA